MVGFLSERVARARTLLAEQPSQDIADFVAAFEHEAAAEAALLERGADGLLHPRQSLTAMAELQGLCHIVRHCSAAVAPALGPALSRASSPLCQPVVEPAMTGGRKCWRVSARRLDISPPNLVKLILAAFHLASQAKWRQALGLSRMAGWWLEGAGVADEFAESLDALGCWPGCTPAQLRCAAGVTRLFTANQVAGLTAAESGDGRKGAREVGEAVQAAQRLLALCPDSARFRYLLAAAHEDHDFEAQMAGLRTALEVAERTNCRYHAALCCYELAHGVVDARPGRYSMEEVEGLLRRGDEHFASAKKWCSASMRQAVQHEAAYPRTAATQRRQVAAMLGPQVGAALLGPEPTVACVVAQPSSRGAPLTDSRCSGCGRRTGDVKRCSRCRAAVYCSLECQHAHWASGHRQECRRLAAGEAEGQAG